jgi:hypothetical protein
MKNTTKISNLELTEGVQIHLLESATGRENIQTNKDITTRNSGENWRYNPKLRKWVKYE